MLNIYITNLGKYNEGELLGKWVELPIDEDDFKAVLESIGVSDNPDENGRYYEEYFITDFETDAENINVKEYEDIDELNALAELIEEDKNIVSALSFFGYDTPEEIEEYKENVSYVCTPGPVETMEYAVGYTFAIEYGCLDIPESIEMYFDFEAYGRDIIIEGNFVEIDGDIYEFTR